MFLPPVAPTGTQQDTTGAQQDADRHAIEAWINTRLEAENAYLRQVLDAEIEARRRADHLVAALMERLPELPASVPEADTATVPLERNPCPLRAI